MNHPLNAGFCNSATTGIQVDPIRNSGTGDGQHRRAMLDRFVLTVYPNICNSGRTHVLLFLQYVFRCWHTVSTGGHSLQHRWSLLCAKCITQLVTVSAGATVPLFSLSVASPKIYECPFSHFSSSETVRENIVAQVVSTDGRATIYENGQTHMFERKIVIKKQRGGFKYKKTKPSIFSFPT